MARILIVEDNVDVVALMTKLLSLHGDHQIESALDGENGLKLALKNRPDLVILDLNLPKLDGHEVCERIRRETSMAKTKILMVSAAFTASSDAERGLSLGADRYLVKPFLHTPFNEAVTSLLPKLR